MFAAKIIDLGREKEIVGYYPDALVKKVDGLLGESKNAFKNIRSEFWKEKDNKDRAVRRAKTKIRRLAKRYDMRYMWTLTFRSQKVVEINPKSKKETVFDASTWESAWKCFTRFISRCRTAGLIFNYVATAEIQEKRRKETGETVFHFHMATDMYIPQNQEMLKKWNHSHKKQLNYTLNDFWTFGFSKATRKKTNRYCSNYMVKYISKCFDDITIKAKQRYHVSEGMVIPVTKLEFGDHKEMFKWIMHENIPVLDKKGNPVSKYIILGDSLEIWWFLVEGS